MYKITQDEILAWNGDDGIYDLANYLAAILNGTFSIKDAINEIKNYNEG